MRRLLHVLSVLLAPGLLAPNTLQAQTDYYNTDSGRPLRTEDAYAIERRALELQVAPLRLERARGGGGASGYRWGIEPEIAIGFAPRTQFEIGAPLVHVDASPRRRTALAGLEVGVLHTLNTETRLPALAVAAEAVLPVGGMGPTRAEASLKALATRTLPWGRVHANAQVALDPSSGGPQGATSVTANAERARWLAGVAIDRTWPLQSLLLSAELVASDPMVRGAARRWDVAAGMRTQRSPRLAVDVGAGYRLAGDDAGWFVTTGAALAVGMPMFTARRVP